MSNVLNVDTINGIKMDEKEYLTNKACSFYKFVNSFGGYATCTKPEGCIYNPSQRVDNITKI